MQPEEDMVIENQDSGDEAPQRDSTPTGSPVEGNAQDGDIGGLDEIREEFEPIRGIRPI